MLMRDFQGYAVQNSLYRRQKRSKTKTVLKITGKNFLKPGIREYGFTLLEAVLALTLLAVFSTLFLRIAVVNWQIIQKCEIQEFLLQEAVNRMEQLQAAEKIDVDLISELENNFNVQNRQYQSEIEAHPVHEGLLEISVLVYPVEKKEAPKVDLITCIYDQDLSPGGSENE